MDTKLYDMLNKMIELAEEAKSILNVVYCNMSNIKTHTTEILANTFSRSNK